MFLWRTCTSSPPPGAPRSGPGSPNGPTPNKGRTVRVRKLLPLLAALALASVSVADAQTTGAKVTTVAAFRPPMLPESVAVDPAGNAYASFPPTGRVVKVAPDGTQTTLATFDQPRAPKSNGLAVEPGGSLLVVVNGSPGGDANGVWRLRGDGTKQLAAALPGAGAPGNFLNDVLPAPDGGFYATDSRSASGSPT